MRGGCTAVRAGPVAQFTAARLRLPYNQPLCAKPPCPSLRANGAVVEQHTHIGDFRPATSWGIAGPHP